MLYCFTGVHAGRGNSWQFIRIKIRPSLEGEEFQGGGQLELDFQRGRNEW
jgi:hypothetical protein